MYYLIDINTGKYLTLYGLKIGFTDNLEIAKSFVSEKDRLIRFVALQIILYIYISNSIKGCTKLANNES